MGIRYYVEIRGSENWRLYEQRSHATTEDALARVQELQSVKRNCSFRVAVRRGL